MKKWKEDSDEVSEFLEYFYQEYVTKYYGWHVGRHFGSPCTNNGLESTNKYIKTHHTFRSRLALQPFLEVLRKMIHEWSVFSIPEISPFVLKFG